jgi:hypothetical protein
MKDHSEGQILSFLVISVFYQALLIYGKPFDDPFKTKMSLFTEIIVSLYLYLLLCLTDHTGKAHMLRDVIALYLVYSIALAVFVNIMIFAKIGFFTLRSYALRKFPAN